MDVTQLTNQQRGGLGYSTIPGQFNSATGQLNSIDTPTTLNGTDIISNPQSFSVPQVDPNAHTNALTSAIQSIIPQVTASQNADTSAENNLNQSNNDLLSFQKMLMGETADTNTAEQKAGLPQLNNDLNDLKTLQTQQLGNYLNQIQKTDTQFQGTTAGRDTVESNLSRQHGIDALLTSSLIQSKEGNITAAQDTVDRAIAAKYDPIKQAISIQQTIIQNNKDSLDRADKKLADDKLEELTLKNKQIDQQVTDETTAQNMVIDASAQNAPQSVIQHMQDIINKGGTPAEVAVAAGQYTGDAAKAQLLKEQIKTEQAQRAKIYSDMKGTDSLLSIDEAAKLGVPYGTTQSQAIKITQGQIGKPQPLNATQESALTSAQDLLNSFDTFGGSGAPVGFTTIFGTLPGTKARDFSVNFDNLKGLLSLDAAKLLKGQGALSDSERQLLADSATKLNRSQTPEAFRSTLQGIISTFQKASPEYQYVDSIQSAIDSTSNGTALTADAYANSLK